MFGMKVSSPLKGRLCDVIIEVSIALDLAAPVAAIVMLVLIVIQINMFHPPTYVVGLMFV